MEINAVHLSFNYKQLANAQREGSETPAYRTTIISLRWHDILYNQEEDTILCDISMGGSQRHFTDSSLRWSATLHTPQNIPTQNWWNRSSSSMASAVIPDTGQGHASLAKPARLQGTLSQAMVNSTNPPADLATLMSTFSVTPPPLWKGKCTSSPQVNKMVWGNFHGKGIGKILCRSSPLRVDQQIQYAKTHHLPSRHVHHLAVLVFSCPDPQHHSPLDNVVPAEFILSNQQGINLEQFCPIISKFFPVRQTYKESMKKHIPSNLLTCRYIFLCLDAHRAPLTLPAPIMAPHLVIKRLSKAYKISINEKKGWVSLNRLKPANLDNDTTIKVTITRKSTRFHTTRVKCFSGGLSERGILWHGNSSVTTPEMCNGYSYPTSAPTSNCGQQF